MASKVIIPASYTSDVYAEGDVVEALNALIKKCDLDELIEVRGEGTNITTASFTYGKYKTMYDGIVELLDTLEAKMRLYYDGAAGKLIMTIGYKADFTDYVAYISSNSLNYVVTQRRGGINHLVCLGKTDEDTGYRAVIHLFTDENYVVQPYRTTEFPLRNRDYILDMRNQVIDGIEERTEVYENDSAITYHYVLLTGEPQKWATECTQYFVIDSDESTEELSTVRYKAVDWEIDDVYTLTTAEPNDWSYNYSNYYYISGIGDDGKWKYSKAGELDGADIYDELPGYPQDWPTNFSSYYVKRWDGRQYVYEPVRSDTDYTYKLQKETAPDDWKTNFTNYYVKEQINKPEEPKYTYKKLSTVYSSAPAFKKNAFWKKVTSTKYEQLTSYDSTKWKTDWKNFYVREAEAIIATNSKPIYDYVRVKATASGKAPTWVAKKYYTRYGSSVAPSYTDILKTATAICTKTVPRVKPEWEENTYYAYTERKVAPTWLYNKYYEKTEDWFKELVAAGIEKLQDLNKSESQTVTLADMEAEIGDIVSGYDLITAVEVREAVTNIIVKIKNGVISLDYEIGGRI